MDQVGVDRTLIVPWLPAQDLVAARVALGEDRDAAASAVIAQWSELNRWAASAAATHPTRICALVGVDPILMDHRLVEAEVALRLGEGACGIKIAPMFLGATADDPRVRVVWDLARAHKVFVLSESGAHAFGEHKAWGEPRFFDQICRAYPDVTIQLAHLGVGAERETARLTRTYPNVYADLSLRLAKLDQPGEWTGDQMLRCIREIGADKVIYGTNYPIVDVMHFRAVFDALDLTGDERDQIAWKNAARVLGLQ
jgi:predicted TIM-barrel fold metal-dependent hydrolase